MADAQKLAKALQEPTISNQHRSNRVLGLIADVLKPINNYGAELQIPMTDETLSEFTGIDGAQSLADDMSYGKPLFSGGSLQTSQIDPRAMDAASLTPVFASPAKSMAKKLIKMIGK